MAYSQYIDRLNQIPLTLAHDHLLPINVLTSPEGLKIIDWEHGRVSAYTTDIARFCSFYYADKSLIDKGLGFFGDANLVKRLKETYYLHLDTRLKDKVSWSQFDLDYRLEELNQHVLNLGHLERISIDTVNSEWEGFFYDRAQKLAKQICHPI